MPNIDMDLDDEVDTMNALILAQAAILGTHARLPFGSANQQAALNGADGDTVLNRLLHGRAIAPRLYRAIVNDAGRLAAFQAWAAQKLQDENLRVDTDLLFAMLSAGVAMYYGAGNCGENANVALAYLATFGYPGLTLRLCHAGRDVQGARLDHCFVLISYPNIEMIPNDQAPSWWRNPGSQYAINGNAGDYADDYAMDYARASDNTVANGYWWDPAGDMPNWVVCDPWPPYGQAIRYTEFFAGGLANGNQPILDATYQIRAEAALNPAPGGLMGTDLMGEVFSLITNAEVGMAWPAQLVDAVDAADLARQIAGAYNQLYTSMADADGPEADFRDYATDNPEMQLSQFQNSQWTAQLPDVIETVGGYVAQLCDLEDRFR